ncbi:predicted protein [Nematostella vectensis]|uniref:HEAT repeat-containing protein 1 n=1 Tax=Nematostella vectensis TaxID=45351 RepID=A7SN29_NEMVE|nr:predicted protein [Nematostella vectensis]|eukprot:XP_001626993.1 predicted protein [Nematostella vectensis]
MLGFKWAVVVILASLEKLIKSRFARKTLGAPGLQGNTKQEQRQEFQHRPAIFGFPVVNQGRLCNRAIAVAARALDKMSSLAKQLKQLQIPAQLASPATQTQKQKDSLLFTGREAADIDNETVFSIARNGLDELELIEAGFKNYEETLFNEVFKKTERSIQSKEFNERLNLQIAKFLKLLSPYFLLKPAQKCLEWLIRRYRVHIVNVDELVACALPYHETNLFVRVVQLLKIRDSSSKWHWLLPLQKSGSPLARTTLLNRCISDLSFLAQICEMVTSGVESGCPISCLRVLFSFYASTLVGVLEIVDKVSEGIITRLLPNIIEGLKSRISEYRAASYMIVAQLCLKCTLDRKLLKSLMEHLCKHLGPELVNEGLLCLTAMCQTQDLIELSRRSFKSLTRTPNLPQHLHGLTSSHNMTALLQIVIPQLVSGVVAESLDVDNAQKCPLMDILICLLKDLQLESHIVKTASRKLLEQYCEERSKHNDKSSIKRLNNKLKALPQILEKRYPSELEKAIEEYLEDLKATGEGSEDEKYPKWTLELMSLALSGLQSQINPDSRTTLTLSLHHPNTDIRAKAVDHLYQMLKEHKGVSQDKDFLRGALLSRLEDDEPSVASAVLDIGKTLLDCVPTSDLVEKLFQLVSKTGKEWKEVSKKAVSILCGPYLTADNATLLDTVVFGQISLFFSHPKSHQSPVDLALTISKSDVAKRHLLLTDLKTLIKEKDWKAAKDSSDHDAHAVANRALASWLGDQLVKLTQKQQLEMVTKLIDYSKSHPADFAFKVTLGNSLGRLVFKATLTDNDLSLCETILSFVKECLKGVMELKPSQQKFHLDIHLSDDGMVPKILLSEYMSLMRRNKSKKMANIRASMNLWVLGNLIRNMPVFKTTAKGAWWNIEEESSSELMYSKILLSVFEMLAPASGTTLPIAHQDIFRQLLQVFIQHHLPDKLTLLHFLANVWSSKTVASPATLQVQSLHIGAVCLKVMGSSDVTHILEKTDTVVVSLLVPLSSMVAPIRKAAVECVRGLYSTAEKNLSGPVGVLIALLAENAEEIQADHAQIKRLFGSTLSLPESKSPKGKSKKKAEQKTALLEYVVRHAVSANTPVHVQIALLIVLTEVVSQEMVHLCLPRVQDLMKKAQEKRSLNSDESICLQHLTKKFTYVAAPLLESDPLCLQLLEGLFSLGVTLCPGHPAPAMSILDQLDDKFFQVIPAGVVQQKVLGMLLDLHLSSTDVQLTAKTKDVLNVIVLKAEQVIEELSQLKAQPKTPKPKKQKRSATQEETSAKELKSWQRITTILELLQHKSNITDREHMVPVLFALLARCVEREIPEEAIPDYITQLVLAEILNICLILLSNKTPDAVPESQFNVELVVQCIRVSENPQTHHQALLLLSTAAKLYPEKVLHNVMSIFTFMGANLLRQDDSYSFQIISKTVDTVIPALIQAGEKQKLLKLQSKGTPPATLNDIVVMVIRVFVDASPHMPEHRRLPVFTHLISTVGAERHLHAAVALLLESYIVHPAQPDDEGVKHSPLDIDFCISLCQEFDPSVQAEGMLKLVKYLAQLPMEKPEGHHYHPRRRKSAPLFSGPTPLFDVHVHSAKHFRQFKFTVLGLVPTVLGNDNFIAKIAEFEGSTSRQMDGIYLGLIEELLKLVTTTAQYSEQQTQETAKKFWRALLHKAYDIIDKVNQLLPTSVFIGVIQRLLVNDNVTVRRKAMELLNAKLAHYTIQPNQVNELLDLVNDLVAFVEGRCSGEETAVNRQTALYSLKLLARLLAEQEPAIFTKVLELSIKIFTAKDENILVASNALLCLAEVCSGLKANAISYLPQFMPNLIKMLQPSKEQKSALLLCCVVTLHKVISTLPHFMSPFLVDILVQVCLQSVRASEETEDEDVPNQSTMQAQVLDRLAAVRKDLANAITSRVLLPAVSQCYYTLLDTQQQPAVTPLLDILSGSITAMSTKDVMSHHDQLFKVFLVLLDFRVTQHQCGQGLVEKIEGGVIDSLLSLVMKMSEATFRPVFLKLVEWATRGNAHKRRLLVFYRLCVSIAEKLKGLMTLFAGYILKNCASLLDANNSSKTDQLFFEEEGVEDQRGSSVQLVKFILDCLQKCLLYSTKGFIDKERFDCLMQPIVDQLENQSDKDKFQQLVTGHVVPCLAQLAVASGSDVYWKPLNYQVLLKTRHTSSQVRFAALKALEELHRQLGEEFIVLLLPESIPFLAELMEDECFEVEQQCQHVVSEIESVIGEPLQKYFEP